MNVSKLIGGLLLAILSTSTVQAQTEAEFVSAFVGDWVVVDSLYERDDKSCAISLSDQGQEGIYGLTSSNCNLELADLSGWRIQDGQMLLLAGENQVATLGGKPDAYERR